MVHANKTRLRILNAAAAEFRLHGFHGAGMRDIAARAGMATGNLYHYFHNKVDILVWCQKDAMERLTLELQKIHDGGGGADKRLHAALVHHVVCLNEDTPGSLAHLEVPAGPARDDLMQGRAQYEASLRGIVEEGISSGIFRSVDANVAVKSILGAVNWTVRWFNAEGEQSASTIGEQCAEIMVRGLGGVDKGVTTG
jgi:AcrR family transcriptional regulator